MERYILLAMKLDRCPCDLAVEGRPGGVFI